MKHSGRLSLLLALGLFTGSPPLLRPSRAADAQLERPSIFLIEGEQKMIAVPGMTRFSLGSPIVRVLPVRKATSHSPEAKSRLLLKGVRPGATDLWVWKQDGSSEHRSLEVQKSTAEGLPPGLEKTLARLEEAEIHLSGAGVVLRGVLHGLDEARRVAGIVKAYPREVQDETELAPPLLELSRQKLEAWLKSTPWNSKIQVETLDGSLILHQIQGSFKGPAEKEWIERRARAIDPLVRLELEALPDANPTVHFRVYLLELRRTRFHSLGLSWPSAQEGAFRVTTAAIRNQVQLDLTLKALAGEGDVRILSSPELVVRAPGDAGAFSGGEFPVKMQSEYYSDVTWKNFGLTLKLHVTHSAGDQVRLDVFTEVSHLDNQISTDSLPGIQSNRIKTQVDAHYGIPLLLSGLLQQGMHQQARGLPALRNIPILGALFGSEDYLHENSELVAILLPSREVPPAPMDSIHRSFPRGELPPEREPADLPHERALQISPSYPWNALR